MAHFEPMKRRPRANTPACDMSIIRRSLECFSSSPECRPRCGHTDVMDEPRVNMRSVVDFRIEKQDNRCRGAGLQQRVARPGGVRGALLMRGA